MNRIIWYGMIKFNILSYHLFNYKICLILAFKTQNFVYEEERREKD